MLSNENIKTLKGLFSDEELSHGLKFAYREIKKEFKALRYLIKTIETSLEKKEIKLKLQADDYVQKKLDEVSPVPAKEEKAKNNLDQNSMFAQGKKQATKEEFEEIYIDYLKKNSLEDNEMNRVFCGIKYEIIEKSKGTISQEDKKEVLKEEDLLSKKWKKISWWSITN